MIGVAAAVVLVVAGCASPDPTSPRPSASPEATEASETEAPAQERETGLVAPAQVFGGDCAALFSDAEVSAAVGATATAVSEYSVDSDAIEQRGGIECSWRTAEGDASFVLVWLFVFPQGAVPHEPSPAACGRAAWESEDSVDCAIEAVAAGAQISGLVIGEGSTSGSVEPGTATLLSLFEERAAAASAAPVPIAALGAWDTPVVCESVVEAADFSAVAGLGAGSTGEGAGGRGGVVPAVVLSLHGDDQLPFCVINGSSADVVFTALGGMRWKGEQRAAAAGATPISVDGLDSVLVSAASGGGHTVDVLDGPNWVRFDVAFTKNAGPIATALVTALDATGSR